MKMTEEYYICDICNTKMQYASFGTSQYTAMQIVSFDLDVWYGGRFKFSNLCEPCQNRVSKAVFNEFPDLKAHENLKV